MRNNSLLYALIILNLYLVACTSPLPSLTSEAPIIQQEPHQPEPSRPVIGGVFSGLSENDLGTFHIYNQTGWEVLWGGHQGNGNWEAVITAGDGIYTVTATVKGYISQPVNYTIRIVGLTAYVVNDTQPEEEAIHLDFDFISTTAVPPTGTPDEAPTPVNVAALPTPRPGMVSAYGRILCNGILLKHYVISLVIIESDAFVRVETLVTDENGRWFLQDAPPATYTILNQLPADFGETPQGRWDVTADKITDFGDVDLTSIGCEP